MKEKRTLTTKRSSILTATLATLATLATFAAFLVPFPLRSQPRVEAPYQQAYDEISAMLDGEVPYSFKRAVFVSENAFFNGTLDYEAFQERVAILAGIADYVARNGTLVYDYPDREQVAMYWGAYMTLKHPLSIPLDSNLVLETSPFTYDFEDFNGDKDWTKMFVTKALATNSGNCHSLPFLYKILVEELGEEAWLAMAPNHTYIKHLSQQHGMYNTELTTGHFPADSWMMASGYVKLDAIVNGVYMDTLSKKESVAVTLVDLVQGYQKKYGEHADTAFVLKCLDKALAYYPHYVNALILKAEVHKNTYEQVMKDHGVSSPSDLWEDPALQAQFDDVQALYTYIHALGYRKMPDDMYLNWLLDVEERDQEEKSDRATFDPPQPFADYGYEVKTATLSQGKYQEFFDQEETTQIGSVVFNRMTNTISHFIDYDTVRSEATMEAEIISRWISQDPLAEEFYEWSPYNYAKNNPINLIDPDGRAPVGINGGTGGGRPARRGKSSLRGRIRQTVLQARMIPRFQNGFATFSPRLGATLTRSTTFSTSRGSGSSPRNSGNVAFEDSEHNMGNTAGNLSKGLIDAIQTAKDIVDRAETITKVESFAESGVSEVSLGFDLIVNDGKTTMELQQLQTEFSDGIMETAQGNLSDKAFANADDRGIRIASAKRHAGLSPFEMVVKKMRSSTEISTSENKNMVISSSN